MRTAAAATALGITLSIAALGSCASPTPGESPGPSPSVTPVFASEEEALAAAEALYANYVAAENELGQGGWLDIALIEPFVRGGALASERDAAHELSSQMYRQVGEIAFDSMTLQQLSDEGPQRVLMTLYLCLDVTSADTVDASGASIVSENRPERVGFEVDIDDVEYGLKISRSEPWSGAKFC